MEVALKLEDFVHDRYSIRYGGNKEALFILNDAQFFGMGTITKVNNIVILVRDVYDDGTVSTGTRQSAIIGFGNRIVGVKSDDASLRGKEFSKDNIESCTVVLYEDD